MSIVSTTDGESVVRTSDEECVVSTSDGKKYGLYK